jgi:hypothetical protein
MSTPPAPSKLSKLVPGCGVAFIVAVAVALVAVVVVAIYLVIRIVAESSTPTPTMAAQTPLKTNPTTTPVPDPAVTEHPRTGRSSRAVGINATYDQPWQNSLGMKFVPVPGTAVLFAIWDTRVQDFQLFVAETGYQVTGEIWSLGTSMVRNKEGAKWNEPGFRCVVARDGSP